MTAQIGQLVRSLLSDDLESYAEQTAELDESGWIAFGEIVGAAFYRAVADRFGSAPAPVPESDAAPGDGEAKSSPEVTAFVAEAAEPYAGTAISIDVTAAEALVRSAMGDERQVGPVLEELDEPDLARIELVLLRALLTDGSVASVEALVSEAEGDAAEFSGEPTTDEPSSAHGQISLPTDGEKAASGA